MTKSLLFWKGKIPWYQGQQDSSHLPEHILEVKRTLGPAYNEFGY